MCPLDSRTQGRPTPILVRGRTSRATHSWTFSCSAMRCLPGPAVILLHRGSVTSASSGEPSLPVKIVQLHLYRRPRARCANVTTRSGSGGAARRSTCFFRADAFHDGVRDRAISEPSRGVFPVPGSRRPGDVQGTVPRRTGWTSRQCRTHARLTAKWWCATSCRSSARTAGPTGRVPRTSPTVDRSQRDKHSPADHPHIAGSVRTRLANPVALIRSNFTGRLDHEDMASRTGVVIGTSVDLDRGPTP